MAATAKDETKAKEAPEKEAPEAAAEAPEETQDAPAEGESPTKEAPPEPPAEDAPADNSILIELDARGFKSEEHARELIKRHDDAKKEAEHAQLAFDERKKELDKYEASFAPREAGLEKAALKLLDLKKEQTERLEQINEKIKLLTKLET